MGSYDNLGNFKIPIKSVEGIELDLILIVEDEERLFQNYKLDINNIPEYFILNKLDVILLS